MKADTGSLPVQLHTPPATASDLARFYERIRLPVMAVAVVVSLAVGFVIGWTRGPYVEIAAATSFSHALYVRWRGSRPGGMTLLIDGAGIALATLTISIPVVTATAFCFYAVVASVLVSSSNAKWVGLFTVTWIGFNLWWMREGFEIPYEPRTRVIIEISTVTFFAGAITLIVAKVIAQLRRTEAERSQAAYALEASNARLERLIESKDRFVASVSHEMRTPLTAVIGLANELESPSTQFTPEDLQEFHRMIVCEAEDVARIVEDLLVAARSDIGEVAIFPQALELGPLVAKTVGATTAVGDRIEAVAGDARALADPVRVKQVVRNLLVNAVRYGGETLRVTVGEESGRPFIEIADNGSGIATGDVERIFEPYQRAHTPHEEIGSIGLGLGVSRTLTRLMGGDLTYARRDGWTVFTVSLPPVAGAQSGTPFSVPATSE
jgi:signal transduction histidine kinase